MKSNQPTTVTAKTVSVRREPITLPTYEPLPPDKNPMFLEKRVYQGSSGKVYPLPFIDRIAEEPVARSWDAVHLENEFVYVMILPEIGGRIHIGTDKTNAYEFFYRQHVIKPALVGLAGPWASGGVEFNWPQHHRPSTYMPTDVEIEKHPDGSVTVWLGEHEPMNRMKGMHGVCLHPGKAIIELKARVYNRTPLTQTFLWWANVATQVHERYQSFFPTDVKYVADHAKRAMSRFPLAEGSYYGLPYGDRAREGVPVNEQPPEFKPTGDYAANDLSWYANIPVPTSYMAMGTRDNFFGGYDHAREAGLVHVANHRISPGKKQWTWGNHEFGYAWDRNLTDAGPDGLPAPYIELMAGVYTDNQPDFSFLAPGETKTWSQFWYPIQKIGPAQQANQEAAISLRIDAKSIRVGVSVSERFPGACIKLERSNGKALKIWNANLAPGAPFISELPGSETKLSAHDLTMRVLAQNGREVIAYTPRKSSPATVPPSATEPPLPADIASADELYITGLHLDQYRHATRSPEVYWREALRRDPGDARCNDALGIWHLRRGEFTLAETCFRKALARLTLRNPNPADGAPYYHLGLTLRHLGRTEEAYGAFYKATWNQAWQAAAFHALAELDCRRRDWITALDHLDRSLRLNTDQLKARALKALVLRALGRPEDAQTLLHTTLSLDPLDWWTRHLLGQPLDCPTQTRLDLALDFSRAGFYSEAISILESATPDAYSGTAPLIAYYLGWLHSEMGDLPKAKRCRRDAAQAPIDYCFPARLEEIHILQTAITANPKDPRAPLYLGNLFYDRRRHTEAIRLWEQSARLDPLRSIVWRNIGIGYFNINKKPAKARAAYEKALLANPGDARLLYERDQLWKRLGFPVKRRLKALQTFPHLTSLRDDLSVELCALYNQTGRPQEARALLASRTFQPWEGGEGLALGQHVRTHLALGRRALAAGDFAVAKAYFSTALTVPRNLGEARHLLANPSDIFYWLGTACHALGERKAAIGWWTQAAHARGDFQEMSVRAYSEMTYFSALSLAQLGKKSASQKILRSLLDYASELEKTPAKIDYFATSLPTLLLFEDDLQFRQTTTALYLQAQAHLGLGQRKRAEKLLRTILTRDPSHAGATDLLDLELMPL